MTMHVSLAAVIVSLAAATVGAATVSIPINQSQSSITVQLCLSGSCDSDTSPVTGYFDLDLDVPSAPTQVTLLDYVAQLTQTINLNISFGFLGAFNAAGADVVVSYATPGVPTGPVAVSNNGFQFSEVPTVSDGNVAYNATGVVCVLFQGLNPPLPCNGALDLADTGVQSGIFAGSLVVQDGVIMLTASINSSGPLDPMNPSAGTYSISGTIRGSAPVPVPDCPGDANGDSRIDAADLSVLLSNFGQSAAGPAFGDFNGDGICNGADLSVLLGTFGSSCG